VSAGTFAFVPRRRTRRVVVENPQPHQRVVQEVVEGGAPPPPAPGNPWPWIILLLVLVGFGLAALWLWQNDEKDAGTRTVIVETLETVPGATGTTTVTTPTAAPKVAARVSVPDVVGQSQVDAGATVERGGLRADSYPVASSEPRGTVVSQDPPAGQEVDAPSTLRLNVSLGEGARAAKSVPDVTGPKESDARAAARAAGFTVRTVDRDSPTAEELGEVLTQEPAAGSSAPELTQITIYVGR
jgi:hypothetical protein